MARNRTDSSPDGAAKDPTLEYDTGLDYDDGHEYPDSPKLPPGDWDEHNWGQFNWAEEE